MDIRDMMADPAPDLAVGTSEVAIFHAERKVLLTGGTSFLERLLIERILRLKVAYYTLVSALYGILLLLIWLVLRFIGSWQILSFIVRPTEV